MSERISEISSNEGSLSPIVNESAEKSSEPDNKERKPEKRKINWQTVINLTKNMASVLSLFITLFKILQEIGIL